MRHVLLSCVLVVAATSVAHAQPPPEASDAASREADDLTHRAVDRIKASRFAEAEELLRRAVALKRAYDIVGNLGIAEAGLEKWRAAAEHLAYALATFPANGKAAHRELIAEKFALARQHVAALSVQADARGAEILVDGRVVGTAPLATDLFVEPGAHVVEARLAGRQPAKRDANVVAGASLTLALSLPEIASPPAPKDGPRPIVAPPPPVTPPVDRTPRIALAVTSGVLALGGLVAGAGLTVAANAKSADASRLRAGLTGCSGVTTGNCAAILGDAQSQTSLARGAVAGFALGGVFAASAVALGVWSAAAAPTVTVSLAGPGVRMEGSW